jgi:regulator-associated protein of mTOR
MGSSPARNPGAFSRQTVRAMSHLHAQYAEASAPRTGNNAGIRSVSPGQAPLGQGMPIVNGRRRTASPGPVSRPSSAPGEQQGGPSTSRGEDRDTDDDDHAVIARPAKPLLLRSKSEHGIRPDEATLADDENYEWGARHGFEDHYQSEDIISQLANVSFYIITRWSLACTLLLSTVSWFG